MAEGRVLLVDDEPSILASYGRTLAESGFEVTKAEGSEEALRSLKTVSFDIVLTDLLVPEARGLALLEKLHAIAPEMPIIVMLDKLSNKLVVAAAERGVLQSLVKPIGGALLRRTMARAIQSRRSPQHIVPGFLTHGGGPLTPVTMNATDAKNQMGRVLETVMQGGVVLISKHESLKAAVISIEEYERFSRAAEAKLNVLSSKFDALLERMQTSEARAGMRAAFDASPSQLAKAAVEFARKRG